jgi:fatty-acyl-CoA synthase
LALHPTADLRAECRSAMAAYGIPQAFLAWEGGWPTSPEGRIDFKRLQGEATDRLAEPIQLGG